MAAAHRARAARRRAAPRARARHADRALRRSRARRRPRRRGGLGGPRVLRAGGDLRRAARRVQSERTGLGPAALFAARAARLGLPPVHRTLARQHARRRRAAHGPRHGALAPLLDSARRQARSRRIRALPGGRFARGIGGREPQPALPGGGRGFGHGLGRSAREAERRRRALVSPIVLRENAGRRARAAECLSARRARLRQHARPADLARLLGRARSRPARSGRPHGGRKEGAPAPPHGDREARAGARARRSRPQRALGAYLHRAHALQDRAGAARGHARSPRAGESPGHG